MGVDYFLGIIGIVFLILLITAGAFVFVDILSTSPKEEMLIQRASNFCESKGGELVRYSMDSYDEWIDCDFKDDSDLLRGKIRTYKGLEDLG